MVELSLETGAQKAVIIGMDFERAAQLSGELSRSGVKMWLATSEAVDFHSLKIDGDVFLHRLFHNRNASLYELFEVVDTYPGELGLVIYEVGQAFDRDAKKQTVSDPNTLAIITTIAQSIRRMESQRKGLIYVCDEQEGQRTSAFVTLFTKAQSIKKMVERAASEAKNSGIRIEYLASTELLGDAEYLIRNVVNLHEGSNSHSSHDRNLF
jgi:hypothetical protein